MNCILETPRVNVKIKTIADNLINDFTNFSELTETYPDMVRKEFGELSRQQYRNMKRDQKERTSIIKSFTTKQRETVDMMLKANEKYYLDQLNDCMTAQISSVNATLSEMIVGFNKEVAGQFWDEVNDLSEEHLKKTRGLSMTMEEWKSMTMEEWKSMLKDVKEFVFKGLEEGKSAKEIKEDLAFKFTTLSKAQIKNAFAEAKEEYDAIHKIVEVIEEPKVEEVVEVKKEKKAPKKKIKKEDEPLDIVIPELQKEEKGLAEILQSKLDIAFSMQKAIDNDIEVCRLRIEELENIIVEKEKQKIEEEVRADNIMQMMKLAERI